MEADSDQEHSSILFDEVNSETKIKNFKTPILIERKDEDLSETGLEKSLPYIPDPLTSDPVPTGIFYLEVIKNGSVIERKEINKPRITFGRSRDADFPMEHPSLSRYHACLLWNPNDGPDGSFFLIDLKSVHGTMVNKVKIPGGKPIKITAGNDIIKLGASSRLFVLTSTRETEKDVEDDEEDDEIDKEVEANKKKKISEKEDIGCTWGFRDDIADEDDEVADGEAGTPLGKILSLLQTGTGNIGQTENEHAYSENPQKTIQQWFDSEGYDFEYKVDYNNGMFKCALVLPVDGQDVTIDGDPSQRKKDALVNVCLRACQVLDKVELLFPWQRQKDVKRKNRDSSDSEEEVIDETDQYKQKKAKKIAAKSGVKEVLNFESLNERWKEISQELQKLKVKLATYSLSSKTRSSKVSVSEEAKEEDKKEDKKEEENVDALDAFMDDMSKSNSEPVKTSLNGKIELSKIRMTIADLEKEQQRVERLLKIAKPTFVLPALESVYSNQSSSSEVSNKIKLAMEKLSTPDKSNPIKINLKPKVDKDSGPRSINDCESLTIKSEPGKIAISLTKKSLIQKPASAFVEPEDAPKPKPAPSLSLSSPSSVTKSPQASTLLSPSSSDDNQQYGLIVKKTEKPKPQPQPIKETPSYLNEEAYVEWLPPKGQTGDGRTALNDKYGY